MFFFALSSTSASFFHPIFFFPHLKHVKNVTFFGHRYFAIKKRWNNKHYTKKIALPKKIPYAPGTKNVVQLGPDMGPPKEDTYDDPYSARDAFTPTISLVVFCTGLPLQYLRTIAHFIVIFHGFLFLKCANHSQPPIHQKVHPINIFQKK